MVTEYFFNFSYLFVWKNGNFFFQLGKIFFQVEQFFFQPGKIFFQFFQVQHFKWTMKFQIRTIFWD